MAISLTDSATLFMFWSDCSAVLESSSLAADSVSLVLDDGDCIVGDLEPFEYLDAYVDNAQLKADWARIRSFQPKRVFFAHMPERSMDHEG